MHVDAAYAGAAAICPEFRPLLDGVEHAMSFNFSPHKWLMVNHDCSVMWVKDRSLVSGAFTVDPPYLQHRHQGQTMPDFRHWQIPLGRRFRSLKLWFVLRMFGVEGLQAQIRKDVQLAREFASMVHGDSRFTLHCPPRLGLVCFRIKGDNAVNERLNSLINQDGRIHLVPSEVKGVYFLRLAVCAASTRMCDVSLAWGVITEVATTLLASA